LELAQFRGQDQLQATRAGGEKSFHGNAPGEISPQSQKKGNPMGCPFCR